MVLIMTLRRLSRLLCAFCALAITSSAYSEVTYYIFPQLQIFQRSDVEDNPSLLKDETTPSVDLFITSNSGRALFLGEVLAESNERHVERIQFGWKISPNSKIWLGRHHSQIGYWRTKFHHGSYLQTSISNPSITASKQPLPTHITGLLWEGGMTRDESRLDYKLSLGLGPELNNTGLQSLDIVNPNRGEHKPGINIRMSYKPDELENNVYGAFFSYMQIPSVISGLNEVKQYAAGVYGAWTHKRNYVFGSAVYVLNELDMVGSDQDAAFSSAYVQAERQISDVWTLYTRIEGGDNTGTSNAYLANFKHYGRGGILGGARYELDANQALKVELAPKVDHIHGTFSVISFEWSAVLP